MWHTPICPLTLCLLSATTSGLLDPLRAGIALNIGCVAPLVWLVDRLLQYGFHVTPVRVAFAVFQLLNESLILWRSSAVTEPLYVVLILASVVALDTDAPSARRMLACGVLLGLACLLRFEGVTVFTDIATVAAVR